MRHLVITGGAGFLGSHLVDALLARDCRVTVLDNLITGSIDNISHNLDDPDFAFVEHDITKKWPALDRADAVMHLASPASPADYRKLAIETMEAGAIGTQLCLELAREHGAVFMLASTSEVYGDPLVHPQSEDYWGNVNPIGPRAVYDEAKRFAEAMTTAYRDCRGVSTRIARIFNTYGPRMRFDDGRVVPTLIHQALMGKPLTVFGDGSQTRSFCYVSDLVEGINKLLLSEFTDPMNLGSPEEIAILELAHVIGRLTGSSSEIEFLPLPAEDPARRRPDISRAKRVLGWEPRVKLEDGLRGTFAYFESRL